MTRALRGKQRRPQCCDGEYWEFNWFFFSWRLPRVDPWTERGGWICTTVGTSPNTTCRQRQPRQDEASLFTDADADGIVDFDEQNRFATSPNDNDTDDCVNDKQDIRGYVFSHLGQYQTGPTGSATVCARKSTATTTTAAVDGDEDKNWNGLCQRLAGC
ncbi:MAG: hypothetical protein R2873_13305 [Caldilineaceae bacterium]